MNGKAVWEQVRGAVALKIASVNAFDKEQLGKNWQG